MNQVEALRLAKVAAAAAGGTVVGELAYHHIVKPLVGKAKEALRNRKAGGDRDGDSVSPEDLRRYSELSSRYVPESDLYGEQIVTKDDILRKREESRKKAQAAKEAEPKPEKEGVEMAPEGANNAVTRRYTTVLPEEYHREDGRGKHVVTYFTEDEILAGPDDSLMEIDDDELQSFIEDLLEDDPVDTLYVMDLLYPEDYEVSVTDESYADAFEEWRDSCEEAKEILSSRRFENVIEL